MAMTEEGKDKMGKYKIESRSGRIPHDSTRPKEGFVQCPFPYHATPGKEAPKPSTTGHYPKNLFPRGFDSLRE